MYFLGLALATLEIQIEGKHGWAEKLPAWRPRAGSGLERLWLKLIGKKLTGYHISLMAFLFLMFHLPFVWSGGWSLTGELETLGFFALFAVWWDFLWFVLNPNYSLREFGPKTVWWHRRWWGALPTDYYIGTLVTVFLFVPLIWQDVFYLYKLLALLLGALLLTGLTVVIFPRSAS